MDVDRSTQAVDPRGVRVALAAASRLGDEPSLRVSPVPDPLRMTNPTFGIGPLGGAVTPAVVAADSRDGDGTAGPDQAADAGPAVLAQRHVLVDGLPAAAAVRELGTERFLLEEGDDRTRVLMLPGAAGTGGSVEVVVAGFRFAVEVELERTAALRERASRGRVTGAHGGPLEVHAIIPGKVVSVSVAPGDTVTAGQQLLAVEAMKMQNELRAPRDGTIERVHVAPGVNIEVGDLLVVIN